MTQTQGLRKALEQALNANTPLLINTPTKQSIAADADAAVSGGPTPATAPGAVAAGGGGAVGTARPAVSMAAAPADEQHLSTTRSRRIAMWNLIAGQPPPLSPTPSQRLPLAGMCFGSQQLAC